MVHKPNEQRMGSGGRRLFDGGAATESMAGSMFRKFWAFAAGAMGAYAVDNFGIDAESANSIVAGLGSAISLAITFYLSKSNKSNMKNGM
jgi:hypothetical protein